MLSPLMECSRRVPRARSGAIALACAAGTTALSTAIAFWAAPHLPSAHVLIIYLVGVVVVSIAQFIYTQRKEYAT